MEVDIIACSGVIGSVKGYPQYLTLSATEFNNKMVWNVYDNHLKIYEEFTTLEEAQKYYNSMVNNDDIISLQEVEG